MNYECGYEFGVATWPQNVSKFGNAIWLDFLPHTGQLLMAS